MSTINISGSKALIESLIAENVETIFGYPGGAIMPIYDALFDYTKKIQHILVRHEQGAIHAAQGFARASGKTGIVFATSGPGATNLVTGLADAMIDSTPIVCITGQVFAHLLGSDAFQEIDLINITAPVTKWNYQITEASEIPEVISKAFYIASSGRPGPVLIDITKNAQLGEFNFSGYKKCSHIRSYRPKPIIRNEFIIEAANLINNAKHPLVIFGQGVILGKAEKEFLNFINKLGAPVAWTILGMSAIPTNHPLAVGMLGMHGNYAPNILTNQCDVLIAIGLRFDDRVTCRIDKYARQAKIIHFDIDPSEIDKNIKVDVQVWGDCKETIPMVANLISSKKFPAWLNQFKKLRKEEELVCIEKELYPSGKEITMGEVVRNINELTNGDAIIVTDVGQHQMVACRYAKFNKSKSNITSGGLGTMGFALPAAIGAKFGSPKRDVIALIGDGGIQMTIQELGTVMQQNSNIKIIILNNNFLGMVRQWQELFHKKRYSFVSISSPDYVKIASGYGIEAKSISNRKELKPTIKKMLKSNKPFLLEVKVKTENNVFPMVPQGKGVNEIALNEEMLK